MISERRAIGHRLGLDKVQVGEPRGAGIWPFWRGGYHLVQSFHRSHRLVKVATICSFVPHLVYTAMAHRRLRSDSRLTGTLAGRQVAGRAGAGGRQAASAKLPMWVASFSASGQRRGGGLYSILSSPHWFSKDKVKWLYIPHAGWPAGLVLGYCAMISLWLAANTDWRITLG